MKRSEAKRKNFGSETKRKYALLISLWSEAKRIKIFFFTWTCETHAKGISFRFVLLWSEIFFLRNRHPKRTRYGNWVVSPFPACLVLGFRYSVQYSDEQDFPHSSLYILFLSIEPPPPLQTVELPSRLSAADDMCILRTRHTFFMHFSVVNFLLESLSTVQYISLKKSATSR